MADEDKRTGSEPQFSPPTFAALIPPPPSSLSWGDRGCHSPSKMPQDNIPLDLERAQFSLPTFTVFIPPPPPSLSCGRQGRHIPFKMSQDDIPLDQERAEFGPSKSLQTCVSPEKRVRTCYTCRSKTTVLPGYTFCDSDECTVLRARSDAAFDLD